MKKLLMLTTLIMAMVFAAVTICIAQDTITGCYNSVSGVMRVLTPSKPSCTSGESPISWNQGGFIDPTKLYYKQCDTAYGPPFAQCACDNPESDILLSGGASCGLPLPTGSPFLQIGAILRNLEDTYYVFWAKCVNDDNGVNPMTATPPMYITILCMKQ